MLEGTPEQLGHAGTSTVGERNGSLQESIGMDQKGSGGGNQAIFIELEEAAEMVEMSMAQDHGFHIPKGNTEGFEIERHSHLHPSCVQQELMVLIPFEDLQKEGKTVIGEKTSGDVSLGDQRVSFDMLAIRQKDVRIVVHKGGDFNPLRLPKLKGLLFHFQLLSFQGCLDAALHGPSPRSAGSFPPLWWGR
jgi:hypothetical protein